MAEWLRKLSGWLRRDQVESELAEEMRTHLEMKSANGDSGEAARRQFGNFAAHLEDARDAWGWPRPEAWMRDFRHGLRVMARRPAFAATIVVTLGLGIGASSTMFSLADGVLLRPLPYPDPERLVSVFEAKLGDEASRTGIAPGRLEDWRSLAHSFDAIAGSYWDSLTDVSGVTPERWIAATVSPGFFRTFETRPLLGRHLSDEECRYGGPPAVVLSERLWRRRFHADPTVIGRSLALSGGQFTIVGVMPATFQYPSPEIELWRADRTPPSLMGVRTARFYTGVGRLKQGVSMEQARADLAAAQKKLAERHPNTDAGWTAAIDPLKERIVGGVRNALWMLLGSVSLLLLIACANVACLLLAQLNSRSGEIATRCSLGASRAAIARQLFIEGLVYALAGGLLGTAATHGGIALLQNLLPNLPRIGEIEVDGRMLGVVVGISVGAAILFSLAPIVQAFRRDQAESMARSRRGVIAGAQLLPRLLVCAQLAFATTLLIGAGLFLRSFFELGRAALGFRLENVLTFHISGSYGEGGSVVARHHRTLEALAALPGVTSVAMSAGLPGVDSSWGREFEIEGNPLPGGAPRFAGWRLVTGDYFATLGIPIVAGRSCEMSLDPARPYEILVNRKFASRHFDGRDPIGHVIRGGPQGESARIVGIVADAKEDGPGDDAPPMVYGCGYLRYWPDSDILVKTAGDPAALMDAVRATMRKVEPERAVYLMRPLAEAFSASLSQDRVRTALVAFFSAMALLLAAVGLYGVMAYMVSQRTREIGIRMALGARPAEILGGLLRSGLTLTCGGLLAGVVLAVAGSRLVTALLYGIGMADPIAYVSAVAVLGCVAFLACLIPGRRAMSVDPTEALRQQ